jgi:hypothetical protein
VTTKISAYVALALISEISFETKNHDMFEEIFSDRDFAGDFEELKHFSERKCGFIPKDEILLDAVSILSKCDLIRITDNKFSGTFLKIYADQFKTFMTRSTLELKKFSDRDNISLYQNDFPKAFFLISYPAFEEYFELGDKWLKKVLIGIKKNIDDPDYAKKYDHNDWDNLPGSIPASDRVVLRSDNLPKIEELERDLALLKENIRADNDEENKFGGNRDLVNLEIEIAEDIIAKPKFRMASLTGWLMPMLKFLVDKFVSGGIADAAKRLIAYLLDL